MPLNKVGSYNKVNEAYISFIQEFEREPSDEELAELLGQVLDADVHCGNGESIRSRPSCKTKRLEKGVKRVCHSLSGSASSRGRSLRNDRSDR